VDKVNESSQLLDFDSLSALAADDPEAFELRRREVIDAAIARANPRRQVRLRGLQWRIEQVRRRAGTPLAACISLTDMMWESVLGEEGLLDVLHHGGPQSTSEERAAASVVALPTRLQRG